MQWLEEHDQTDAQVEMLFAAVDTGRSDEIINIRYLPFS
jgi:hypothetical protein